jgi:hypothetical protein
MKYRITAWCANGDVRPIIEYHDNLDRARQTADWLHHSPGMREVELAEPYGVQLIRANGDSVFEHCETLEAANDAAASWLAVIDNKKINRTRVRQVHVLGVRDKTAVATEEDKLVGAWMAAALEDHKVCPSMKFDINRWMDSKEWT